MKNTYFVNYEILFLDDMETLSCGDYIRAASPAAAVDQINYLYTTSETTARIFSVDFVA